MIRLRLWRWLSRLFVVTGVLTTIMIYRWDDHKPQRLVLEEQALSGLSDDSDTDEGGGDRPEAGTSDRWVDRRRTLLADRGPSKVFLFSYMRGGSSIGGELFDLDPKAMLWYEPLDAFYSYVLGTSPAKIPFNLLYKNRTRRRLSESESTKLVDFLQHTYSCQYRKLPPEAMSHSFLKQSSAMDDYTACFKRLPENATARYCKRYTADVCGTNAQSSLAAKCPQLVDSAEHVYRVWDIAAGGHGDDYDIDALIHQMAQQVMELFQEDGAMVQTDLLKPLFQRFIAQQKCLAVSKQVYQKCLPNAIRRCRSSSIHVMEANRMKMEDMDAVLHAIPDLHVIYYSRDPRAIALSRSSIPGFTWDPVNRSPLREIELLCHRMAMDVEHKRRLVKKYPGAILHVRYEDLIADPKGTATKIYGHLFRKVPKEWTNFAQKHFSGRAGRQGKFGNSVGNATVNMNRWMRVIPKAQLKKMDPLCREVLRGLGYPTYSSLLAPN